MLKCLVLLVAVAYIANALQQPRNYFYGGFRPDGDGDWDDFQGGYNGGYYGGYPSYPYPYPPNNQQQPGGLPPLVPSPGQTSGSGSNLPNLLSQLINQFFQPPTQNSNSNSNFPPLQPQGK